MARKLLKNKEDIYTPEELVQEMYMKLYERFTNPNLKPLTYVSTGYIFRMMRNMIYKKNDLKQYEFLQSDDFWQLTQSRYEYENELLNERLDLADKLDTINYLDREVLLQHMEKSQHQLQRETGVNRDRLRMYKRRALNALKQLYRDEGEVTLNDDKI